MTAGSDERNKKAEIIGRDEADAEQGMMYDTIVPNPEPAKIHPGVHVTARGLRTTSGVTVKASNFVGQYF